MFQIINEVKEVIENFIADEDKSVMIIQDTLEESPLLLKVFGIVEESEESNDIFLSFGDEFQDTRRFVEAIIENQKLQIEALNIELEKVEREKIAEIPINLLERDKPSNARLELLFKHIRKNVEPERRVIWVFHPLQDVEKDTFYADLFEYISQRIFTDEINFTKIIVRDTPTKILQERLAKHKQVFVYQPKISHKDIFKKIEESAKSKDTPNEEKAQSIMLLAGIDIAERRYEKALSRNRQVLNYYEKTKQKPQQSIVQNNIGDVFYVQGKYAEAQAEYEKAILIAVEEKSQPLVLYQSVNLGNSLFMQQKYDEAFIYYDSAAKLAEVNQTLPLRIQALEKCGDTKKSQEKIDEAIEIWGKTAEICRQNKYKFGLVGILERLTQAFEEKNDGANHRSSKKELEQIKQDLREINPHLVND